MTAVPMARRKPTPLPCRSSPAGDPVRLVRPHLWLIAPAEQPLDQTSSLSLPSQKQAPALRTAQSTIPTMPSADKSP
jgi:hypothetical protein